MEKFLKEYQVKYKTDLAAEKKKSTENPFPDVTEELGSKKRKREEETAIVHQKQQVTKKQRIDEREEAAQSRIRDSDPPLPKDWSIFTPDPTSATTTVFIAPSFSGKTTLIVEELNKLTDDDLDSYTAIVLCTESIASAPLKKLSEKVLKKMNILDCFVPEYVSYLKKTNTMTHNRFRYLVIMDDCLRLRGDVIVNMILTLRNSGVSTAISIQYSKLLSPAQRQSIHDYYLLNLRLEDLEYLLQGFIASHMRDKLNQEGDPKAYDYSVKKLAEAVRHRLRDYRILHYDQRHDRINIYST